MNKTNIAVQSENNQITSEFGISRYQRATHNLGAVMYATSLADHYLIPGHPNFIPTPPFLSYEVFHWHAGDFFCAPVYALTVIQPVCIKAHNYLEKRSPMIAYSFRENYNTIRSIACYGMFGALEKVLSVFEKKPFDENDMIAYGLGLTVLMHGQDIVESIQHAGKQLNKAIGKMCGVQQNMTP